MKRIVIASALILGFLGTTAASCTKKPKGRDVERVAEVCGPEIAARYERITWVERDYASDNILITCVLFPAETLGADQVRKDQIGG